MLARCGLPARTAPICALTSRAVRTAAPPPQRSRRETKPSAARQRQSLCCRVVASCALKTTSMCGVVALGPLEVQIEFHGCFVSDIDEAANARRRHVECAPWERDRADRFECGTRYLQFNWERL